MAAKPVPPLTVKGKRLDNLLKSLPAKIGKADAEFLQWYIEMLEGYSRDFYNPWVKELLGLHRFPDEKDTDNE